MSSLYPSSRDTMRRVVDDADEAHAKLLRDMYDSIIAVEQELGVRPSGIYGSLYGRIFGSELVATSCGYWRKLHTEIASTTDGYLLGSFDFPTQVTWAAGRMDGTNTVMGDDTPFVFPVYQGRGPGSPMFDASSRRYGQPWYLFPFFVKKDRAWVAGVGADHRAPQAGGTATAQVGVIAWGLQPSPTQSFQEQ